MNKTCGLFLAISHLLGAAACLGQGHNTDSGLCKQLTIEAAQLADVSYTYAKSVYFSRNAFQSTKNADTAIYFMNESVAKIDSAITLAPDSSVLAKEIAAIAKKYALAAKSKLSVYKQTENSRTRVALAEQAVSFAQNATVEAYHASFYFKDAISKKAEPVKDTLPRQVTKLDVDQALFALLDGQLLEKERETENEIEKLKRQLKTTKDATKATKLKAEIKKLEDKDGEFIKKDKDAKEKLGQINSQIEERDKNKALEVKQEQTVFSKIKVKDEWNKNVLPDADIPMGLTYLVQIGVYKNAITPETFKGVTPIFAHTVPGGISYSTGYFEKFDDAKQAKMYLQSMGLSDAFVVPFYNKKKVAVAEALKLEKGN